MKCVKCNLDNESEDKFCVSCGDPLQPTSSRENCICTHCGAKIDIGSKFCIECGKAVVGSEPASASIYTPFAVQSLPTPEPEKARVADAARAAQPVPIATSPVAAPSNPAASPHDDTATVVMSAAPATAEAQSSSAPTSHRPVAPPSSAPTSIPGNVVTTSTGGSRGLVLGAVIAVVIGGGAYWFMGRIKSPETALRPSETTGINSYKNPVDKPQISTAPTTQSVPSAPTRATGYNVAMENISALMDAVIGKDEASLQKALDVIKQMPVPRRGDRAAARAANTSGLAYLRGNELERAIASFREGTAADPSDPEIVNNLGYALSLAGLEDDALEVYAGAIVLAPERALAWANLGVSFAKMGQMERGVAAYLLSYRFSQSQENTRTFLLKRSEEAEDSPERELAIRVLKVLDQQ